MVVPSCQVVNFLFMKGLLSKNNLRGESFCGNRTPLKTIKSKVIAEDFSKKRKDVQVSGLLGSLFKFLWTPLIPIKDFRNY